ncbi:MAG: redoxin domain-containing protein [Armatimonadetes bacterium]|nr:redoxin domain-containing protein [Armatimonadota bacterium]
MSPLLLAFVLAQDPVSPPAPAPRLDLDHWMNTPNGRSVDPQSYKGKVVLLHIHPSFCCGYEFTQKMAEKVLEKHGHDGLIVIGINSGKYEQEQLDQLAQVTRTSPIRWPLGYDSSGRVMEALYPGEELRYSFSFIDRRGLLRKFKLRQLDDVYGLADRLVAERP